MILDPQRRWSWSPPTITQDTDGQWIVSCLKHRVFVKFETVERAAERSREHEAETAHWWPR